jgi:hypothetical protein
MSAKPWFPFFPSDWRADSALRMCSPGARLLWLEMLCVMHEAEPRGHLLVNGKPITVRQMAMLAAVSEDCAAGWLGELEETGVFSRDEGNVIFSRKMVRDSKKSEDQRDRVSKRWSGKEDRNTVGNTEADTGSLPHIHKPEPYPKERDKESLSERGKDFEAFWAAYPNKVGKAAALKSYKTAARKTDLATMLAAIEAQRRGEKWTRDGGRFIPNPATWLNQERWEDGGTDSPPPPAPGMPGTRWAFV